MADQSGEALGRAFSAAVVRFHEAIARQRNLSAADNKTLDLLDREGPISAGELAARIGVTGGAVTGLIDRLEAGRFVHRTPDPSDRRRTLIAVSEEHAAAMTTAFAPLSQAIGELLASYTPAQTTAITDFLARATTILTQHAEALETTSRTRHRERIRNPPTAPIQ